MDEIKWENLNWMHISCGSVILIYNRVSTTPGNPGNLLEFENPPGNPGNLLEFKWSSWKFLCNDRKLMMWHCLCIEECNIKMLLML